MSGIQIAETIEDLQENPTKYGMPTFEEFRRNKEKYIGRYDEMICAIDKGDFNTGAKQRYYMQTECGEVRLTSLEQAERIAVEMGLSIHNKDHFKIDPQYQHGDVAGKHWIKVTFWPKELHARRASW